MQGLLSDIVDISRVMNAQAASTSDTLSGSIVDLAGWDGVLFVAILGDVTATAVATLQAQQNTANSSAGMATLAGTAAQDAAAASDQDNKLLLLDVHRPAERYVRPQLVRATANVVVDGILAIRYKGRSAPVTQGATVLDLTQLLTPAEA